MTMTMVVVVVMPVVAAVPCLHFDQRSVWIQGSPDLISAVGGNPRVHREGAICHGHLRGSRREVFLALSNYANTVAAVGLDPRFDAGLVDAILASSFRMFDLASATRFPALPSPAGT
ncbi:MAG: hypothetical protein CM15mP128_0910 [Methanobacteriota archaeon]|nr:MAG: hypothetical protein CM15mP128_0910 [Euryarchaeota archaeon]